MNPTDIDFIIFHSPCPDGSIAAFSAYLYFSRLNKEIVYYDHLKKSDYKNKIVFHGTNYGRSPPNVKDRNVLICDFSYDKKTTSRLIKSAKNILIIDHHKTSEKDLEEIDDKYKIFDMTHSGAWLTWKYFFPNNTVPKLINYIQDRDLWTKQMHLTDAFSYWFTTLPHSFQEYEKYLNDDLLEHTIIAKGIPFMELNNYYINDIAKYAVPKFMKIHNNYYFVVYVNGTLLKSDIGNRLLNFFPYVDFSAVYSISDTTNATSFSLRSSDVHVDVSSVAKFYKGGGHRNASGLFLNKITNVLDGTIYDTTGTLYHQLKNLYHNSITLNNITYNIVYLNSLLFHKEIGNYLLQIKYNILNNDKYVPIQESTAILNIIHSTNLNIVFDIAVIWDYTGFDNTTSAHFVFNPIIDSSYFDPIKKHFNVNDDNIAIYNNVSTYLSI